jgi:NAD(P)-dependent dehydrogenase (short-subunit alcohol dehydrogenase family)
MSDPTEAIPRRVLVTGAAQRVGRALAVAFAEAGWAVGVHHRGSADAAADLVGRIESAGGHAAALRADLARDAETGRLVPAAAEALGGPIGALVNNASQFEYDAVDSATRADWDRHMEVNLRAPFVLVQAFAAQLPPEAYGAVVNILDQRVWNLTPHFVTYTLSKSGLWTLTRTLALALAPRIRVNAIGPGPTLPNARQTPEQFERQARGVPLGRATAPEEIAAAALYLVGAPSVTGQMLALDGGQHMGWAQADRAEPPID